MDVDCGYCYERIAPDDFLECEECEQYVHVRCLRRPGTPGDFIGDIFFKFTCLNCTLDQKEEFVREKLPWTMMIVLALYNLSKKSQGLSRQGYFHWRSHIASFIDRNWVHLMESTTKRRKNWIGTISGTLSHNSPVLFSSGSAIFNEGGWWKLTQNKNPKQYFELIKRRHEKGPIEELNVTVDSQPDKLNDILETAESSEDACSSQNIKIEYESEPESCSRTLPFMGKYPWHSQKEELPIDILDFMDSNENSNLLDDMPLLPELNAEDIPNLITSFNQNDFLEDIFDCKPYEVKYACKPSLFKSSEKTKKYPWETDMETDDIEQNENIELMDEYEENEIYKRLTAIFDASKSQRIDIPPWIRRYYRKLCVRKTQRSFGLPIFNIDKFNKVEQKQMSTSNTAVLDRFHHLISSSGNFSTGSKINETFMARLAGACQYDLFVSPHTERILHPFIYRNDSCVPPWVKLMCELQYEVNGSVPSRASIDYCYVRPQHVAAVNALLQRMFWPGIDMSECLSYPDFTVVALYKKLVIGCAFLVPDVGHNEAYVSFMCVRPGWQNAGIATFMLYHLTQTCIGKDITLHVSATNPAICLYQKFGFKIQELILDFYDKYLPFDSSQSRHAFLLRLER